MQKQKVGRGIAEVTSASGRFGRYKDEEEKPTRTAKVEISEIIQKIMDAFRKYEYFSYENSNTNEKLMTSLKRAYAS